jgi:hypothetical protein
MAKRVYPLSREAPRSSRGLRSGAAITAGAGASIVLAVACNALLGNEEAALLAPDGATADAKGDSRGLADAAPTDGASKDVQEARDAGPCGVDAGQPVTITNSEEEPFFITADDAGHVYWATTTEIFTCPISGCGSGESLETPDGGVAEAPVLYGYAPGRLDGGLLFWASSIGLTGSIEIASVRGGPFEVLFAAPRLIGYVAIDETTLVGCETDGVWTCDLASLSCQTVLSGACDAVATDMTNVYWTNFATGQVNVCALPGCAGGKRTLLSDSKRNAGAVVVANGAVYFVEVGSGIFSLPVDADGGVQPQALAMDPYATWLATDGTNLYWSGSGVHWCPLDDCTSACTLYPDSAQSYGIAVDSTNVYWTESITNLRGRIMKSPKPKH